MSNRVIVVGGGLAGHSAAHQVLQRGGSVLILDKSAFCGGNSTKATSGINGALTRTQMEKNIPDSAKIFEEDCRLSAGSGDVSKMPKHTEPLVRTMARNSAADIDWLVDHFGLDLSIVGQLGGHSFPRTHRGKERFPGMTITYALMEEFERIQAATNGERAQVINRAKATRLLTNAAGHVTGVVYEKDGAEHEAHGPVILASGGFGADFSKGGWLEKVRPDVLSLATTNGDHCTGDALTMGTAVGAGLVDMERVQVHPTGLVDPAEPDAKLKFLAAEALRGTGALMLDGNGKRFVNELGRRDWVSNAMFKNKGPFRLVLNSKASAEILWHCKHYTGRGLMKKFSNGGEMAKDMGIPASALAETFATYNKVAADCVAQKKEDNFGKKFFRNFPFVMEDEYYVAVITPVVHYTMGGLHVNADAAVLTPDGKPIPGLWAAGECMGGVHGINRLGGNSLLDCVVYGRVSGNSATKYLLETLPQQTAANRIAAIARHLTGDAVQASVSGANVNTSVEVQGNRMVLDITWQGGAASSTSAPSAAAAPAAAPAAAAAAAAAPAAAAPKQLKTYTLADVAAHNTEKDCWVVVNGEVLDVTKFLPDHPGGKKAIMLFAGRDASEEFNMLHKPDVISKYYPEGVIGKLAK